MYRNPIEAEVLYELHRKKAHEEVQQHLRTDDVQALRQWSRTAWEWALQYYPEIADIYAEAVGKAEIHEEK